MEAESALVWTKGRVKLHPVAPVDLALALIILPNNTELDDAFRDRDDFEGLLVFGVLLEEGGVFKGGDKLWGTNVSYVLVVLLWLRRIGIALQVIGNRIGFIWRL